MKKIFILLSFAAVTLTAVADLSGIFKKYEPKFQEISKNINTAEELRLIADSLIRLNPKDPFYNIVNIYSSVILPDSSLVVKASEAALKNLSTKYKDERIVALYFNGIFSASADSLAAFETLKQAWGQEPWALSFPYFAELSYTFSDSITLKNIIDTAPAGVTDEDLSAARLMLSSLTDDKSTIYDRVIKFVDGMPVERNWLAAFRIVQRTAPERLPHLVAYISAQFFPLPTFAEYYKTHREAVDAELDKLLNEAPEDKKWEVEIGRYGFHRLLKEDKESWKILKNMEANNWGESDFLLEYLIDTAIKLGYSREIIEYTDSLPLQGLPEDIALARLGALSDTDRKEDIISLANQLMRRQPDLAFFAYYYIANAEFNDHQWQKALDAFNTALVYNEDEGSALINKAYILKQLGRDDEAEAIYKTLVDWDERTSLMLNPDEVMAFAKAYSGDKEGALSIVEKQLAEPDIPWYNYSTPAYIYYYFGEKEKGADLLLKAQELYPHAIYIITICPEWDPYREDLKRLTQTIG